MKYWKTKANTEIKSITNTKTQCSNHNATVVHNSSSDDFNQSLALISLKDVNGQSFGRCQRNINIELLMIG